MNQAQALTVTDVNRYIKALLGADEVLSAIAIRGEISNFKPHPSGHMYFTLKDQNAEIAAVMFRGDASRMNFRPANGMRVVVYGNIDVYEKSGRYQVYVRTMLADGVGALYMELERLKKKLEAEGLFDESRKKPLPPYPTKIGVITASSGAALRDILNITGRRYPTAEILICPALVQGGEAPASLCAGLELLNAYGECDVIILGRGGGSIEDLWAFNDEQVARAVAASRIPVISAVGHETDFTLCDFVADRRAPTPSAAAELAVPDRRALYGYTQEKDQQMRMRMCARLEQAAQTVTRYEKSLALLSPMGKLSRMEEKLRHEEELLDRNMTRILEGERATLATSLERLNALNPLAVLERGYAAVKNEEGNVISRVSDLAEDETVTLLMHDGTAKAKILSKNRKNEGEYHA
ncbi:MAG: exodeoxyribonuclease VII large subunit [Clostridia bacterium]|nr:exodeoxyribonuclease VII large subunit [Clostridia bacterium]